MRNRSVSRKASSMLEFTFVGIPLMFILISIFEISRGMWMFNTLAHSVKEGVRMAVVHGNNCVIEPNACSVTTGQICQEMRSQGPGLDPARVIDVTFITETRTITKADLSACLTGTETFPVSATIPPTDVGGAIGRPVEIRAKYRFDSALAFFWTGSRGFVFGRIYLPAIARERVRY